MADSKQKVALVTGTSSGIGESVAIHLTKAGFRVFGTSRRGVSQNSVVPYETLTLDVTDDASVEKVVTDVIGRAGRIDVLVNNAGFGVSGAAEESSVEQAKSVFETNVFGVMRMIRAVLPHMRVQGSGRIINMSSILGLVPSPYMAIYASTKHALEGYSESLDHEIRKFGIRVILIEPAYTKTKFGENMAAADQQLPLYEAIRLARSARVAEAMAVADDADVVGKVVAEVASAQKPRLRYTAGKIAARLRLLRRYLPEAAFDSGLRKQFHLDQEHAS